MTKVENNSQTAARGAGAGVGLALVATAVGVGVPAAHAEASPTAQPRAGLQVPTLGATALAPEHRVSTATPTMTYRVVAGDTVSEIAARTGSSVRAIVRENNLNDDALIRTGQMLRIPSAAGTSSGGSSSSSSSNASSPTTHTVKSGETLSELAARYDTSVSRLVSLNDLASADLIYVGQRLRVSGDSSAAPSTPSAPGSTSVPASPSSSSSRQTHTVVSGDTVSHLAARYGTSVQAIIRANDLGSNALIYVGQKLTIGDSSSSSKSSSSGSSSSSSSSNTSSSSSSSSSGSSSVNYTVASGDTVSGLAARFGVSAQTIVSANRLGSNAMIYVGQKLTVPTSTNLVGDSFLGRTYPEATVASANANKAALLAVGVPSRAQMQSMVVEVAQQMGVDPALAQAHAYQESGFNHASVSPANAIGTMQVIPSSGEWASGLVGRELNLLDPHDNVVAGVAIIRALQGATDNLEDGIAGYYQGLGAVREHGFYDDTKHYVAAIKAHMNRF
ncbi:hypothetical protein GCM10023169_39770 [Georgenia halophila]|uniref:LysM domain-containing protein n=1 Tax=Georgenia halophila TaxID=620889 RepID=A0ABP8LRG3_9MICO